MIVSYKPFTIYDVDVIGFASLVVVGLAAWFGLLVPTGADASECRQLSASITKAETRTEQTDARLHQVNRQIELLKAGVAQQTRSAPKAGALAQFVQLVASLADECDMQIVRVLPQPVQKADGYLIGDVHFSGQGTSLGFVRLLDRLARQNPYCALRDFSIVHPRGAADNRCQLSWSLRLHMLDDGPAADEEKSP